MPDSPWSFTFADTLTGVEIATLPMVGVSFNTALGDVGQLTGTVPTVDPVVRALDPWAATAPRRTSVLVQYGDTPVWGGRVLARARDQGSYGLTINAYTYESWLAGTYLRADANYTGAGLGAPSIIGGLVRTAQSYPNSNYRIVTQAAAGGSERVVGGQLYPATDVKSLADYLKGWAARWGTPIEWRVDITLAADGRLIPTLLIHDGTFADGRDTWTLHYPGELLAWSDQEDGTAQANIMVGGASGADSVKLFSVVTAADVGSDEFAAGYPAQMASYSVGGTDIHQDTLDATLRAQLLDRLVQGQALSNIAVRPTADAIVNRVVGDPVDVEITHPAFREWPLPAYLSGYRMVGKKISVGGGTTPDQVSLDLVPAAGRLPSSVTPTATFLDMLSRIRRLEVASTTV